MDNRYPLAAFLALCATFAQAGSCEYVFEMAKDVASLRDAGVSLVKVEARLRKDVLDPEELAQGLAVARLVYKTRATGQQLKAEGLKKCK